MKAFDGIDILGTLDGDGQFPDRPWFTYMDQNNDKRERLAVNYNKRKLVVHRPAPDGDPSGSVEMELFAIEDDSMEERDGSAASLEVTQGLLREIDQFLELKSESQIDRFTLGKKGFTPPKEWQIEN